MRPEIFIDLASTAPPRGARDPCASAGGSGVCPSLTRQLLGGRFRFESDSAALLQLVEEAYGGLPAHTFHFAAPEFRVELRLVARQQTTPATEPSPVQALTATNLPRATIDAANYAEVAPEQHRAVIVISEDMLAHAYHVRYGLLEFAVFILAARCIGLVPLHGACVGRGRRGVLLLGTSGSGKSTLALHGLLQGLDLLAEDAVFVEPESMLATGLANYLHVTGDALRLVDDETRGWISRSPVIRRRSGVEKYEADPRKGPGRLAAAPLELAAAVFVLGEPAEGADLLQRIPDPLIDSRLSADQAYAMTQPGWCYFSQRLKQRGVYELRRGQHPHDTIEGLRRLLD